MSNYHILNGDALKDNFPSSIEGDLIIMREILIEGPVQKENFFQNRAKYIHQTFGASETYYKTQSEDELKKMDLIPSGSDIHLWFEDDLFCQCNLWYCISRLASTSNESNLYLVRPDSNSWLGFGAMNSESLPGSLENKIKLSQEHIKAYVDLWEIYENGTKDIPESLIESLTDIIPRIKDVLQAHIERMPPNNRPLESLKKIMAESENKSFPSVFKRFSQEEGIYGYGDSSIKSLYDQLIQEQ